MRTVVHTQRMRGLSHLYLFETVSWILRSVSTAIVSAVVALVHPSNKAINMVQSYRNNQLPREEIKDMPLLPENERLKLYKRPDVRQLLSWTVQGHEDIRPLPAKIDDCFPEVSRILGDPERSVPLLEELSSAGLYHRVKVGVEPVCPECGDSKISSSYVCPYCESWDIEKGARIEHYACGHVDYQNNFYKDGQLICPKCENELRLIGTDYQRIGNLFHCNECKRDSSIPKIIGTCIDHGHTFSYEEANLKPVYGYTFNETLRDEIAAHCLIELPIIRFMESMGYMAKPLVTLIGGSGADHTFDIVATGGDKTVVFALTSDQSEISREAVLNFFAKLYDVKSDHAILVAMPRLSADAQKLANLYSIEYIEGETIEEVVNKLRKLITEPVKPTTPGETTIELKSLEDAVEKIIPNNIISMEKATPTPITEPTKPSTPKSSAVEMEILKDVVEMPIPTPEKTKDERVPLSLDDLETLLLKLADRVPESVEQEEISSEPQERVA